VIWSILAAGLVATSLLVASISPAQIREGAVSLGQANDGRLLRGVRLPDRGVGFSSIPAAPDHDARWGTEELVKAVIRIGADLERRAPAATLIVGDLSLPEGGPSPRHESHQAGRDVDLLFYAFNPEGQVVRPRAVNFDGEGNEVRRPGDGERPPRVFDTGRNWLILRSLIENQEAHLQRVLVSEPLRELLLGWAREQGEPSWIVERAGEVMCSSWSPHSNHFHVRLFCTAEDYGQGCRDEWPLYPWRRTELAARGIFAPEVVEDPNQRRPRARRWLTSRSTGRLWCR
jgi:penicillin-insensitive murein endopeptidase